MTVFHLVRHGAHDQLGRMLTGRTHDVGLNEWGLADSRIVAKRLKTSSAVYASPLRRTVETAAQIAADAGVTMRVDTRLLEVDFGAWSGMSFAELDKEPAWRRWNHFRAGSRPPGGETMVEAQARIVAAMLDLRDRHGDADLVLVSHGDLIKAALAYWVGVPLDQSRRIEIAPASISRVSLSVDGVSVQSVNEEPAKAQP